MAKIMKKAKKKMIRKAAKKTVRKKAVKKKKTQRLANPFAKREREFEIEDGLRTLMKAEEIKNDSKMMKEIEGLKKKKMAALNKV